MRRRLLEAPLFDRFWSSVVPLPSKEEVVDRYELGLSAACRRAGLNVAAIYDAREAAPVSLAELWPHVRLADPRRAWRLVRKGRRNPHNPSELLWRRLLEAGIPFVKASVFRTNHYGLDLGRVTAELARRHPDIVPLIRAHLARCG
jgi:lipopolysaccharide biosynthesis protein